MYACYYSVCHNWRPATTTPTKTDYSSIASWRNFRCASVCVCLCCACRRDRHQLRCIGQAQILFCLREHAYCCIYIITTNNSNLCSILQFEQSKSAKMRAHGNTARDTHTLARAYIRIRMHVWICLWRSIFFFNDGCYLLLLLRALLIWRRQRHKLKLDLHYGVVVVALTLTHTLAKRTHWVTNEKWFV